jgi:hypothetical protein
MELAKPNDWVIEKFVPIEVGHNFMNDSIWKRNLACQPEGPH